MANFDVNGRQLLYDGRAKFPGNFVQSNCIEGDGLTNYVIAPTSINSFPITMYADFIVDDNTQSNTIISLAFSGSSTTNYDIIQNVSSLTILLRTGGVTYSPSTIPNVFPTNGRYQIFLEFVNDTTINYYLNNTTAIPLTPSTSPIVLGTIDRFGMLASVDSTPSGLNDGKILCAGVYPKVLTAKEKQQLFDKATIPSGGSFYVCSEGNSSTVHDIGGNGNHGTWTGTPQFTRHDFFHWNICNGCDLYSLDADPNDTTDYLRIPWRLDGEPAATSATGYTKIQGSKGWWHNGAETLIKFDPCPENLIFNKNAIVGNSDGLPEIWLATIQGGDWYDAAFGTDYQWMWSHHELNEDYIALHANPNWTGASLSSVTKRMFACAKNVTVDGTTKETLEGYINNVLNYHTDLSDSDISKIDKFCENQNKKIS